MSDFEPIAGHIRRLQLQRSVAVGEAIADALVKTLRFFQRARPRVQVPAVRKAAPT